MGQLNISPLTVDTHVANLRRKFEVHTGHGLVSKYQKAKYGLIEF